MSTVIGGQDLHASTASPQFGWKRPVAAAGPAPVSPLLHHPRQCERDSAFSLTVQKGRPEADQTKSTLSLLITCIVLPLPMLHPSCAVWAPFHSVSEIPVLSHIFGGHFPRLHITRRQPDFLGQCAACSGSPAVREMPPGNSLATPMVGCMGVGCNGISS